MRWNRKQIAIMKRNGVSFSKPAWDCDGHSFGLKWNNWGGCYRIFGGCRRWDNLAQALRHYDKDWEPSDRDPDRISDKYRRQERRKVVRKIAAFAKKYKIKLRRVR
jgi:hypothetical protein